MRENHSRSSSAAALIPSSLREKAQKEILRSNLKPDDTENFWKILSLTNDISGSLLLARAGITAGDIGEGVRFSRQTLETMAAMRALS